MTEQAGIRYAPTRRRLLRDATLVTIGMVAAACQPGATPGGGGKKGGEFHGAWPYDLPPKGHYNYFNSTGAILAPAPSSIFGDLHFPSMAVYRWADAKWEYWLAESHSVSGNIFEVKLRSNVKWDDGTPFTSKDVLTTFQIGRMESFGIWRFIDKVEAPDDRTVRFNMTKPSSLAERLIMRIPIRSDKLYNEIAKKVTDLFAAGKTTASDEVKALRTQLAEMRPTAPISVGPYKIDPNTVSEAQLTMVKNPGGLFADKVNFDKIVVYQGETAQVTPLVLAGDVDYATHGFPVATDKAFQDQGLRVIRGPLYTGPALYFHWEKAPEFQDIRLRQAVAHAINRNESGSIAYGPSAKAPKYNAGFPDELVPNWIGSADQAKLKAYEYDVAKAEQLMKDAGYAKVDGIWAKGGKKLEFEMTFPSDFADWSSAATHASDALNKFGIKITPRGSPNSQQLPDFNNGKFQIGFRAWGIGNPHAQPSLERPFREYNTTPVGGGMKYPNKQKTSQGDIDFDALLDEAAAGTDLAKQKAAITKIALAFNELLPCVPLWSRYGNNPVNDKKRVSGWPKDGDPIYQNASSDNFTVVMIMNGTLGSI